MALLRRVSLFTLRNAQRRGGKKVSFWSEGTKEPEGYLFNETPPPPGQKRKWEGWELPWCVTVHTVNTLPHKSCATRYLGMGGSAVTLTIGLTFAPNTNIQDWAREQAAKELAESKE